MRDRYRQTLVLLATLCCLPALAAAGPSSILPGPPQERTLGATYGQGDTITINQSDMTLTMGVSRTRVLRVENSGIRPDEYAVWTSTSGDASVFTEYENIASREGTRARFVVPQGQTREVSLTFTPSTCYKSVCDGSLTIHVLNTDSGRRYDIPIELTVKRAATGVSAPGVMLPQLAALLLLAAVTVWVGRPGPKA
ncbi:MAG: hypothetical protein SV186_00240 [Candidatus Nanohaloarchaea archaeon]|nr:hypothetical protein [Candidatus Nanohaloarchaea archaeon]